MLNSISLLAILSFAGSVCVAKEGCDKKERIQDPDIVVWEDGVKLKWPDFQSNDFAGIGVTAGLKVKLKLDYEATDKLKWFEVQCFIIKKEAVARRDKTDYVLNHEQGHFDLGEVYARKLRKNLFSIRTSINQFNSRKMDSIYNVYVSLLIENQKVYDRETDHSNDTTQQAVWDLRIKKNLDSLSEFSKKRYLKGK